MASDDVSNTNAVFTSDALDRDWHPEGGDSHPPPGRDFALALGDAFLAAGWHVSQMDRDADDPKSLWWEHLRSGFDRDSIYTIKLDSEHLCFGGDDFVRTFRYVPQVIGDPMVYSGPIELDTLVDLDALAESGAGHWTFLAFPTSTVNEHGVPDDIDAQRYIAAVQAAGVPVGIWCNSPSDGTAYAAVTHDTISHLHRAIEGLTQFHDSYAADLSERLFRESSVGGT